MRFLLPEQRPTRHPNRFETFIAVGGGLASTAATVGSAAMAAAPAVSAIGGIASAGLSAASAMGAFGGGGGGGGGGGTGGLPDYKTTFSPIEYKGVENVGYNPQQGANDLLSMFPALADFAAQATAYQTRQREKMMPGSQQRFSQASNVLGSWLSGQVPQDVVDATNRAVAERTGGTFNPATGGGKSQADFARSIGKLSSDFTQLGVSAAPAWLQLADSFVVKPMEVSERALQMNQVRYQYDALNADINQFNAKSALETQMFNASGGESGALSEYNAKRDQAYAGQAASAADQANAANLAGTFAGLAGTGLEAFASMQPSATPQKQNANQTAAPKVTPPAPVPKVNSSYKQVVQPTSK